MIAKLYWRVSVFVLALVPLLHLFWGAINEQLGADPGKALVDSLGSWALLYLLACLSMTPLRKMTGWAGWQLVRRQQIAHLDGFILRHVFQVKYLGTHISRCFSLR